MLVPSLVVTVAVGIVVVVAVLLLIWLMRRPGCQARLPVGDRERQRRPHIPPESDGGDNLDDTSTPKGAYSMLYASCACMCIGLPTFDF